MLMLTVVMMLAHFVGGIVGTIGGSARPRSGKRDATSTTAGVRLVSQQLDERDSLGNHNVTLSVFEVDPGALVGAWELSVATDRYNGPCNASSSGAGECSERAKLRGASIDVWNELQASSNAAVDAGGLNEINGGRDDRLGRVEDSAQLRRARRFRVLVWVHRALTDPEFVRMGEPRPHRLTHLLRFQMEMEVRRANAVDYRNGEDGGVREAKGAPTFVPFDPYRLLPDGVDAPLPPVTVCAGALASPAHPIDGSPSPSPDAAQDQYWPPAEVARRGDACVVRPYTRSVINETAYISLWYCRRNARLIDVEPALDPSPSGQGSGSRTTSSPPPPLLCAEVEFMPSGDHVVAAVQYSRDMLGGDGNNEFYLWLAVSAAVVGYKCWMLLAQRRRRRAGRGTGAHRTSSQGQSHEQWRRRDQEHREHLKQLWWGMLVCVTTMMVLLVVRANRSLLAAAACPENTNPEIIGLLVGVPMVLWIACCQDRPAVRELARRRPNCAACGQLVSLGAAIMVVGVSVGALDDMRDCNLHSSLNGFPLMGWIMWVLDAMLFLTGVLLVMKSF